MEGQPRTPPTWHGRTPVRKKKPWGLGAERQTAAAMGVRDDYEIFKNALVYTVTFKVVSALSYHSEGGILTLTASAFMATTLLQNTIPLVGKFCANENRLVRPLARAASFTLQTLVSAGLHMQSNLLGSYASSMYKSDAGALYLTVSSAMGIVLVWVLGVSIGAIDVGK